MSIIVSLKKTGKSDLTLVGSKSFRLAELLRAGFTTPLAFSLSTRAFDKFLHDNNLSAMVARLTLGRDEKYLEEICHELQSRIVKGKIKSTIRQAIIKSLAVMGAKKVAVRSSATCEDGEGASFAGQFDSFLDLYHDQVLEAIRKCWASVYSPRVLTYALFHEIPFTKIKMACLIQEMVVADIGGLAFTKNFISQEKNTMVIEAAPGSPEEIVSAISHPNRWILRKKNGHLINRTLTSRKGVLDKQQLNQIRKIALKIENFYRKPQDIEWIIRKGVLFILQARPLTT